jgi:hypothetical protein
MDEREPLQAFLDHLPLSAHFSGIRDRVRKALKLPRGSTLPTFSAVADEVLDAYCAFRRLFRRVSLVQPPPPQLHCDL